MSNDQAENLRQLVSESSVCKMIFFTSVKPRLGKTTLVTNIANLLSQNGHKVLILDSGAGLLKTDILFNVKPKHGVTTLINNGEAIDSAMVSVEENLKIIYSRLVFEEVKNSQEMLIKVKKYLEKLKREFDFILVDTDKIDINSLNKIINDECEMWFALDASDIETIKSTYISLKEIVSYSDIRNFGIILNKVEDSIMAKDTFNRIQGACEKFLNVKVSNIGYISKDTKISESIKEQLPVTSLYRDSNIYNDFNKIVSKIKLN